MNGEGNLRNGQSSLKEQTQRYFSQLGFDQSGNTLMTERENLFAVLFPQLVLMRINKINRKSISLVKLVDNFWPTTEITLKSENENAFIYLMVRAIDFL